jgi:sulfur-oxidizing protein SoxX
MNWTTPMLLGGCAGLAACAVAPGADTAGYTVSGDAIPEPLAGAAGDPQHGREVVVSRDANCLLCHSIPETGQRFMGNVGPTLSGVGARLTAAQIRLRVVDYTRVKPDVAMPAYYRARALDNVAEPYRGKTVLTAQQVEDVVAYLVSLR